MAWFTLFFILVAVLITFFAPGKHAKIAFAIYFLLVYILLDGITGLVEAGSNNFAAIYSVYATDYTILFIHLPLVMYMFQLDHKHFPIKKARQIFAKDIMHLSDHELQKYLSHHHK